MGIGLQCFDANGALTFDAGDHLARFVGSVAISASADGSINVPGLAALGTVFVFFLSNGESVYGIGCPSVTVAGDVISWSYNNLPITMHSSGIIFYGVN
jgi:hypothetical protein